MHHSVETLASKFDVTLIGPSGCSEFVSDDVAVIECPSSPFGFLTAALVKGLRPVGKTSFDLVLGGSGLVAPITWIFSQVAKARSFIFVHGLDLVVDNFMFQYLFVPFIRRHDRVIANSQNTRELAIAKDCSPDKVTIVNPGCTIPPESSLLDVAEYRAGLGYQDRKVILFVGRMVRRKGLAEFLTNAWPRIIELEPDAVLLVAGDTPGDALLKDPVGSENLLEAIEMNGKDSVDFLGTVDDNVLWHCYAAAEALVFPLIRVKGDVEGFGMVAIEAAASGTPTVAFPVGGVVDAVVDGSSGVLVPEGDYEAFADAVVSICNGGPPSAAECRSHAEKFSWDAHGKELLSALDLSAAPSAQ